MATQTTNTTIRTAGTNNNTTNTTTNVVSNVFTRLNETRDIVTNQKQTVSETVWSNGLGTLTSFYTSSTQPATEYYLDLYDANPQTDDTALVQCSIAYGHVSGLGGATINGETSDTSLTPTKAIYSQYRNLLIPYSDYFNFGGSNVNHIAVVNFERSRLKEKLDIGNWELTLSGSSMISLIDDSSESTSITTNEAGTIYNIVSGTILNGVHKVSGSSVIYGKMYTDYGYLIMDAELLKNKGIPITTPTNTDAGNVTKLFKSINGGLNFKARNNQNISTTFYFVRVANTDYNFTNNPSFTTGSLGDFRFTEMINNPLSYITTVGLYNDNNELLAIAKLSKPLKKDFTQESIIRVALNY